MNQTSTTQNDPQTAQLSKNVDRFLSKQRELAAELDHSGKRKNLSINDLIAQVKDLSVQTDDLFFSHDQKHLLSPGVIEEVKLAFASMRNRLNGYAPKKRFFILETMNFFSSKISIGKLIPALLVLDGSELNRAIAEFVKPTFLSINKNVEILASTNEIFNPKTIHLDRGSLYTLVSDIARVLTGLFKPVYLNGFDDVNSHVELMLRVMSENPIFSHANSEEPSQMLEDSALTRKVVLEFVSTIQSHEALYNYALKRHAYYKLFLARLTSGRRFGGVAPFEVSRVFAGVLLGNRQLAPPESLVKRMLDPETFSNLETLKECQKFVALLSPSMVYKLIGDIKNSLQTLSQTDLNREFGAVSRLSITHLLKRVWSGFIAFGEKGLDLMTEPFRVIFTSVKKTYRSFVSTEAAPPASPEIKIPGQVTLIPKNDAAVEALSSFKLVQTDVVAFRGELEGASQKDYGYNARLFKQDEVTIMRFRNVFERLFVALENEEGVRTIRFPSQHKIREYYGAFMFENRLLGIGLTHQKQLNLDQIQQKDIFPYALLFSEAKDKAFGRVLSRVAVDSGKLFNEESLTANNSKVFYETIYILLHLLPEADWENIDCQLVIKFLLEELAKVTQPSDLIYLKTAL